MLRPLDLHWLTPFPSVERKGLLVAREAVQASKAGADENIRILLREEDSVRLANALKHPLRVRLLIMLNARAMAPVEAAREMGLEVTNVAYHMRTLEKYGCLEVVAEEKVRGSTKHTFKAVQRTYLEQDAWSQLPLRAKAGFTAQILAAMQVRLKDAIEAGTIDSRDERHLTASTLSLDEAGWKKATDSLLVALDAVIEAEAESAERAARGEDERFWATFGIFGFEAPRAR